MSTKVKQKAREIDALIEANAAAARGEVADGLAVSDQQDDSTDTQATSEVAVDTLGRQDTGEVDDAGALPTAVVRQLDEARSAAQIAEQRWRSLDGQLRSKDEQIERLTDLVSRMTQSPQVAEEQAPAGVEADDSDTFGDDMIDFVQRVTRQVVRSELEGVMQAMSGLKERVQAVTQHTAVAVHDSFESRLDKLAPGWRDHDREQAFHSWLDSSATKKELFLAGAARKEAPLVAEFFNLYMQTLSTTASKTQTTADTKQSQLEKQIAPGKSRSTAVPTAKARTDTKIWTRTEIATAYSNKQRGHYSKDEWAAMEQEIARAQREDRVDYNK